MLERLHMTVQELIDKLQNYDPDCEVILGNQPSWPFELRIDNVIQRKDMFDDDDDDSEDSLSEDDETCDTGRSYDSFSTSGLRTDVIIVEGGQIRYGDKKMFEI